METPSSGNKPGFQVGGNAPLKGENATEPGSYGLFIVIESPIIDPGEKITGKGYITGYGNIDGAKIWTNPPGGVFSKDCTWCFGLKKDADLFTWGGNESKGNANVVIVLSGGLRFPQWAKQTIFFDATKDVGGIISTETTLRGHAPLEFSLTTLSKVRPGTYQLVIAFTYYNGNAWMTSSQTVDFVVRNILQRNEKSFAILGVVAATVAILVEGSELIEKLLSFITD